MTGSVTCATQPLGLEPFEELLVDFEGVDGLSEEVPSFGIELAGLLGQMSVACFSVQ